MKINAKRSNGAAVSVDYNFGDNIQETCELFGEDVVFNRAIGSLKVALQGWLRSQIDQGKSEDEIQKAVAEWKPGQRRTGKSPQEKLREQLAKMSPEDRAALLKEYRAK